MLARHLFHRKPTSLTLVTESKAVAYVTISSLWNWANSHSFLPYRFQSVLWGLPCFKGYLLLFSCSVMSKCFAYPWTAAPRLLCQSIETDWETRFSWSPFSIWKKREMSLFSSNLLRRNSYLPLQYQSFFFFFFGKIVYSNLLYKYCITLALYFGMQEEIPSFIPLSFSGPQPKLWQKESHFNVPIHWVFKISNTLRKYYPLFIGIFSQI